MKNKIKILFKSIFKNKPTENKGILSKQTTNLREQFKKYGEQ